MPYTDVVGQTAGARILAATLNNHQACIGELQGASRRIEGGYWLDAGLLRFRQSLGSVGKTIGGVGLGGVDVCVYGDSIAEGGESSDSVWWTWAHLLKMKLQAALNPPGVVGGYGYMPAMQGPSNGTTSWAGLSDGTYHGVSNHANYLLTARKVTAGAGFAGNAGYGTKGQILWVKDGERLQWVFDGSHATAAARRWGVTRAECIGSNISGSYGGPIFDWFDNTGGTIFPNAQTAGTGLQTGSFTPIAQANAQHGRRWSIGGAVTPLDATKRMVLQLTGPAAVYGNTDLILYNGDYDCGIRLHNMGYWGQTVASVSGYTGWLSALDVWGSGIGSTDANGNTRGGAVNAKLYLFDFITNDAATAGEAGLAAFSTAYAALVDRVLALPTKPSVLLIIPPRGGGATAAVYRMYADAIHAIAAARDHVALLDLWEYTGEADGVQAGRVTELSWYVDATHYSDTAQQAWANILFEALMR